MREVLVILFVVGAGFAALFTSRNRNGMVGDWQWSVRGGVSGAFHAWVLAPGDRTGGGKYLGDFASFDAAKAAALREIGELGGAIDVPPPRAVPASRPDVGVKVAQVRDAAAIHVGVAG